MDLSYIKTKFKCFLEYAKKIIENDKFETIVDWLLIAILLISVIIENKLSTTLIYIVMLFLLVITKQLRKIIKLLEK